MLSTKSNNEANCFLKFKHLKGDFSPIRFKDGDNSFIVNKFIKILLHSRRPTSSGLGSGSQFSAPWVILIMPGIYYLTFLNHTASPTQEDAELFLIEQAHSKKDKEYLLKIEFENLMIHGIWAVTKAFVDQSDFPYWKELLETNTEKFINHLTKNLISKIISPAPGEASQNIIGGSISIGSYTILAITGVKVKVKARSTDKTKVIDLSSSVADSYTQRGRS